VIQKRYGKSVRQEVAGELMQRNFYEAIIAEKINPAGRPEFVAKSDNEGEPLVFEATFEIYPEVELKDIEKIDVERPVVQVTDEDLDEMFVTLQKQHQTWKENKRKTKNGDKLTIDFTGRIDGEEFEGGKAENFELELGSNRMIPGFEKEITGMKTGEEKTIKVTFPEDYHAENLKGKEAEFDIVVKKTEGPVLPEVNDEFAKLFGIEEGGVEALREEVRKNMERELTQAVKAKVKEQVIEGLLAANNVDLPKALVAQEVEVLRKQAMQRFAGQMDPKNMPELPADMFTEQAEKRVKIGLLLGEVIKQNELKVDDKKVDELIESAASAYEDPQEVINYYKNNQELYQQMQNVALEEQAVDFITEKAKVTDKETTFKEIMNPEAK
jgi:trigger factor